MRYRKSLAAFCEKCSETSRRLTVGLILVYQWCLSPFLPPSCRFYPTCSEYAMGCIERHGALKGIWMGVLRLLRCHPFHPGGYDPVP